MGAEQNRSTAGAGENKSVTHSMRRRDAWMGGRSTMGTINNPGGRGAGGVDTRNVYFINGVAQKCGLAGC